MTPDDTFLIVECFRGFKGSVMFEIVDAQTVRDGRQKYVVCTDVCGCLIYIKINILNVML